MPKVEDIVIVVFAATTIAVLFFDLLFYNGDDKK